MALRASILLCFAAVARGSYFTWLPLGDSITWGCGNGVLPHEPNDGCEADAASYRIPTCQGLEQTNITVATVGSRTAGPKSAPVAWKNHEGWPGYRIDQLNAIAPTWTAFKPDVVSMLVGANDCLQGDGAPTALDRMVILLNTTATALPTSKVFIASILDVPTGDAKTCQVAFNAGLPALVKQADAGRGNFIYVPMAENTTGVCGDDRTTWSIGDGVHPNAGGHARVASVWIPWMRNILCPNYHVDQSC